MTTEARVRRKNVECPRCGNIYQVPFIDGQRYQRLVVCNACDAIENDDTVKARISSQGECALCGRQIVLEDGVPTHLERERDEWHRPMFVTAGF